MFVCFSSSFFLSRFARNAFGRTCSVFDCCIIDFLLLANSCKIVLVFNFGKDQKETMLIYYLSMNGP
jgi:hypothetical protein